MAWRFSTNAATDNEDAMRPNPAVNTDAHRRGFARAVVAGYLGR
jgi:hypothetical protein